MGQEGPFRAITSPGLQESALIVTWREDAGRLGTRVAKYLRGKLDCQPFGEIDPSRFFPLAGVAVESDVARFPESTFYYSRTRSLSLFSSDVPAWDWSRFLGLMLDVARDQCGARELYTVGGMVSMGPYDSPRQVVAVANSPEMKRTLSQYEVFGDLSHETQSGQRPTMSSYLLWMAKTRNLPAASLWVPVPFYLATSKDQRAARAALRFLDERLELGLEWHDLDEEQAAQDQRISEARSRVPEINDYLNKLESNQELTQEESETLAREIEQALRQPH